MTHYKVFTYSGRDTLSNIRGHIQDDIDEIVKNKGLDLKFTMSSLKGSVLLIVEYRTPSKQIRAE